MRHRDENTIDFLVGAGPPWAEARRIGAELEIGALCQRAPWACRESCLQRIVAELCRERAPHRESAEPLDAPFTLFQVERTGAEVPMQELLAPNVEIQPLLPERGRREHMRPEGRIEGPPHVVGSEAVLAAG